MTAVEHDAGPVALVTGGSGTIGGAMCRALAGAGYTVAVHRHRGGSEAEELAAALGGRSFAVKADVRVWPEVAAMEEEVRDRVGPVDVLVNAAGVRADGLMAGQAIAEWHDVIDVNLLGTFHTTRAVLPSMLRRRRGQVVNVVSPSAFVGNAGQTAYSAAKAGVVAMTRSLACECAKRSVVVNALSPGFVATAMTDGLADEVRDDIIDRVPLRRPAEPEEIADALLALLGLSYVTGHVLAIDGGLAIT